MARSGSTPPARQQSQVDWERRHAYNAVLKAEQALEMAGLENEARQLRKIRLYVLTPVSA
jgi:hypothetical protein